MQRIEDMPKITLYRPDGTVHVPVLEIMDEFESKSKMPEAEFQKWFNIIWNRLWSDAPREETVEEMWAHLISQGCPKDAFYDECLRRGIIIRDNRA